MKNLAAIALLVVSTLFAVANKGYAQTSGPDVILGKWVNEDKTRTMEFVRNGTLYDGVIVSADNKEIVGKTVMIGLKYSGSDYQGKLFLPKRGKTFPCTAKLNDNNTMEITGNAGFASKSKTWTRVR
jgi:uncharacterized protein (DUF2147 family)